MFHVYVAFLILSGIAMLVMAGVKSGQATARRAFNALFGAAFTIYGLYLLLFFQGGHYLLFYYVFILPILMIVRFFRDRSAFQARQAATAVQGPPPGFGQPPGYGQPLSNSEAPGYGQPLSNGQAPGYGQPSSYGQPTGDQPQGPVR